MKSKTNYHNPQQLILGSKVHFSCMTEKTRFFLCLVEYVLHEMIIYYLYIAKLQFHECNNKVKGSVCNFQKTLVIIDTTGH